ncbi:MAG: hypothetical protein ABGW77_04070 [Campylobacterales bacterium]
MEREEFQRKIGSNGHFQFQSTQFEKGGRDPPSEKWSKVKYGVVEKAGYLCRFGEGPLTHLGYLKWGYLPLFETEFPFF